MAVSGISNLVLSPLVKADGKRHAYHADLGTSWGTSPTWYTKQSKKISAIARGLFPTDTALFFQPLHIPRLGVPKAKFVFLFTCAIFRKIVHKTFCRVIWYCCGMSSSNNPWHFCRLHCDPGHFLRGQKLACKDRSSFQKALFFFLHLANDEYFAEALSCEKFLSSPVLPCISLLCFDFSEN